MCNIFPFIYCVFDIDMHIFVCIEVVIFEIKLQNKRWVMAGINVVHHIFKSNTDVKLIL